MKALKSDLATRALADPAIREALRHVCLDKERGFVLDDVHYTAKVVPRADSQPRVNPDPRGTSAPGWRERWHPWTAWHPVRTLGGRLVALRVVERRQVYIPCHPYGEFEWQYRLPLVTMRLTSAGARVWIP